MLSVTVTLSFYDVYEKENLSHTFLEQSKKEIENHGFSVPCPAGTYVIIPWSSSGIPLGNPGLTGGLLFFDKDTVYFGEEKNK